MKMCNTVRSKMQFNSFGFRIIMNGSIECLSCTLLSFSFLHRIADTMGQWKKRTEIHNIAGVFFVCARCFEIDSWIYCLLLSIFMYHSILLLHLDETLFFFFPSDIVEFFIGFQFNVFRESSIKYSWDE